MFEHQMKELIITHCPRGAESSFTVHGSQTGREVVGSSLGQQQEMKAIGCTPLQRICMLVNERFLQIACCFGWDGPHTVVYGMLFFSEVTQSIREAGGGGLLGGRLEGVESGMLANEVSTSVRSASRWVGMP